MQAKVVSIRVRPLGVTHLCFETGGILGDINLSLNPNSLGLLGATAPFFDFDLFYAELASRPTVPASGSITFKTNPAAGKTITLDGTVWTFVTALTTGTQLLIGSTLAATLAAAATTLQFSNDPHTNNFRYAATTTSLDLASFAGPPGDLLAFSTNVPTATVSGPTLRGADSSRLFFDSLTIQAQVSPYALASLRAEPQKAVLNKAILLRQNAYFAKYANSDNIIARMNQYYFNPPDLGLPGPPNTFSKSYRLAALSDTAENQWAALNAAYANAKQQDGEAGVVGRIVSTLYSDVLGYGYSASSANATEYSLSSVGVVGPSGAAVDSNTPGPPDPWSPPAQWPPSSWSVAASGPTAGQWASSWNPNFGTVGAEVSGTFQKTTSYAVDSNKNVSHEEQNMHTANGEFRHPFYEAMAKYQRAQVSLVDQQFAAFMSAQNLPHLATVFNNELVSIDSDVYRLQIAYLNTILLSPFPGVVTGVYKNPGDAVRAGEPVLRIENNGVILLDTVVIYRGPILINKTTASVTTALFGDSSGQPTTIPGLVVAARVQDADDKWHIVIECNNMDGSTPPQPIFPLGYRFDSDDTTISFT
jgi:biotin carboxyl carrier protein